MEVGADHEGDGAAQMTQSPMRGLLVALQGAGVAAYATEISIIGYPG